MTVSRMLQGWRLQVLGVRMPKLGLVWTRLSNHACCPFRPGSLVFESDTRPCSSESSTTLTCNVSRFVQVPGLCTSEPGPGGLLKRNPDGKKNKLLHPSRAKENFESSRRRSACPFFSRFAQPYLNPKPRHTWSQEASKKGPLSWEPTFKE